MPARDGAKKVERERERKTERDRERKRTRQRVSERAHHVHLQWARVENMEQTETFCWLADDGIIPLEKINYLLIVEKSFNPVILRAKGNWFATSQHTNKFHQQIDYRVLFFLSSTFFIARFTD